jgi:hypothetical protein
MVMDDFDIEVKDETAPDYDIADNFAENLVDAIRADMVGNEEVYLITHFNYATGLFPVADHYNAQIITGSSSEGKSAVKQKVDRRWPPNWMLRLTDMSEKGAIDDDRFNNRYIFAGDELNKLPSNAREILKSTFGDDADEEGWGYTYVRNTSQEDGDADHEEKKKQTMPFVVLMADENQSGARDWELSTRMMETKVESDEDINEAVSETMWDADHVTVPDREYEYEFNFEEGKQAIDHHIANIPRRPYARDEVHEGWMTNQEYANPVVIPHDDSKEWPVDGGSRMVKWHAHNVAKPMLPFGESDSKRASKLMANLTRGSTLLNYHNRETTTINGLEYYIAEPQDLGNVIAVRATLMSLTHDIDGKKMAVIDALTDEHNGVGAPGPNDGVQATVQDIAEYIDEYADISSLTEDQLRPILDEMANRFLMTIHEGEGQNGAHLYEYHGGSAFGHPNLDMYPDAFENVTDPIRDHHISETVREHKEMLSDTVVEADDIMSSSFDGGSSGGGGGETDDAESDESGTLSSFTDEDDGGDETYDEIDTAVAERLSETVDDKRVTSLDDLPTIQHMLGISPVEYEQDDRGMPYVTAARPREDGDREGTLLDNSHHLWGDKSDEQVESRVENSIAKLRANDVFEVHEDQDKDGHKYIVIHTDEL